MYLKIPLYIFLLFLVFTLQLSFLNPWPGWLGFLDLGLVILIFVLELKGLNWGLIWGLGLGLLFDIFYFQPFGVFLLSFLAVVLFSYFLLVKFFTNRSLYSYLVLILVATVFFDFFLRFLIYFLNFYSPSNVFFLSLGRFWIFLGKSLAVNALAVVFFFYFFNFLSDRFNAVFLKK